MKRAFLIVSFVLAVVLPARAQIFSEGDGDIGFDFRAGANISNMSFFCDSPEDLPIADLDKFFGGYKVGFNFSADVDFQVLSGLYIETGLSYYNKGDKASAVKESARYNGKINLSYLEMPLLASLRFDILDDAQLRLDFGGYAAYGLSANLKMSKVETGSVTSESLFGSVMNRWDFGTVIGLGSILNDNIYSGFRFEYGLRDISAYKDLYNIHNWVLLIQVGFAF